MLAFETAAYASLTCLYIVALMRRCLIGERHSLPDCASALPQLRSMMNWWCLGKVLVTSRDILEEQLYRFFITVW